MKATHVRVIETTDLATGEGEVYRAYGYFRQHDTDPGREWVTLHVGEGGALNRSADQVRTWARNDGIDL